mmetsp:Transcript_2169/g.8476  ORF Transcript_2169/g.8476 Transcript_2169/m.8476 type:complete len:433 (-) Transcript_2169:15-1313(-)
MSPWWGHTWGQVEPQNAQRLQRPSVEDDGVAAVRVRAGQDVALAASNDDDVATVVHFDECGRVAMPSSAALAILGQTAKEAWDIEPICPHLLPRPTVKVEGLDAREALRTIVAVTAEDHNLTLRIALRAEPCRHVCRGMGSTRSRQALVASCPGFWFGLTPQNIRLGSALTLVEHADAPTVVLVVVATLGSPKRHDQRRANSEVLGQSPGRRELLRDGRHEAWTRSVAVLPSPERSQSLHTGTLGRAAVATSEGELKVGAGRARGASVILIAFAIGCTSDGGSLQNAQGDVREVGLRAPSRPAAVVEELLARRANEKPGLRHSVAQAVAAAAVAPPASGRPTRGQQLHIPLPPSLHAGAALHHGELEPTPVHPPLLVKGTAPRLHDRLAACRRPSWEPTQDLRAKLVAQVGEHGGLVFSTRATTRITGARAA